MEENKLKWKAILDIVTVCKKMWQKEWVANHDGNVTVRIGNELLATPTAVSKADVIPEIILTLDMDGKKLAGPGKSFSEASIHLAAYRARGDVMAVVHAHPPYATARGACGIPLNRPFIPESVVSIGDTVPVIPFAMPGDPANERAVAETLQTSNVFMMQGNGVFATGTDVMQAYLRLELVEHLAKMEFIAKQTGVPFEISDADKAKLLEKREAAGLAPPQGKDSTSSSISQNITSDNLSEIIAQEIKAILDKRS